MHASAHSSHFSMPFVYTMPSLCLAVLHPPPSPFGGWRAVSSSTWPFLSVCVSGMWHGCPSSPPPSMEGGGSGRKRLGRPCGNLVDPPLAHTCTLPWVEWVVISPASGGDGGGGRGSGSGRLGGEWWKEEAGGEATLCSLSITVLLALPLCVSHAFTAYYDSVTGVTCHACHVPTYTACPSATSPCPNKIPLLTYMIMVTILDIIPYAHAYLLCVCI